MTEKEYRQKEIKERLCRTEEKYRRLLENIEEVIVRFEIRKGITFVNQAVERITGYKVEEYYSNPKLALKIVHPDFRERLIKIYKDSLEGKFPNRHIIMKCVRKDGKTIWLKHKLIPILNEQGEIEAFDIIGKDITKSQERLFNTLDSSIDGMALLDADWNFVYINPKYAEVYGYTSPEELIGKNWKVLLSEKELDNFYKKVLPQLMDKEFWVGQNVGQTKHGLKLPQTISLKVLKNEFEEITGFTCVVINLAERERSELQRRQAQSLEAVGELARGIAHNFNNMLTGIMGYTQLLLSNAVPESREYNNLEAILEISQRASDMVRQLLDFSRASWNINPGPVNLNLIVKSTVEFLRNLMSEDIEMEIILQEGLWDIKADIGQIKTALVNLAMNANEAMSDSGKFTIETQNLVISDDESSEERKFVMISVSDTGYGIDKDIQDRIFDPFFSTKDMGTGLGLSQVYGIVKQHRGIIDLESEQNEGTRFNIYFPVLERKEEWNYGMIND